MRIPKYYEPLPVPPPPLPKPTWTLARLLGLLPKKLNPLQRLGVTLTLLFVGCWWLDHAISEGTFSLDPVPIPSTPHARLPEEQIAYNAITSIKSRFSSEQIDNIRKDFQITYMQRNKAIQEAVLSGKMIVNGQKTSQADAILLEIDNNTLKVFQQKYSLSRQEMDIVMSGSLP
ncbi:MAG: hypothetical protein QM758_05185 [Armatimonas sp.]